MPVLRLPRRPPALPPGGGGRRRDPPQGGLHKGEEFLLARNARFPEGRYSIIAGFVEPGETLEEAVAREIREEVGLVQRPPPATLPADPISISRRLIDDFLAEHS